MSGPYDIVSSYVSAEAFGFTRLATTMTTIAFLNGGWISAADPTTTTEAPLFALVLPQSKALSLYLKIRELGE